MKVEIKKMKIPKKGIVIMKFPKDVLKADLNKAVKCFEEEVKTSDAIIVCIAHNQNITTMTDTQLKKVGLKRIDK